MPPMPGCDALFCAARLLKLAKRKGLPSKALLGLGAPGFLACGLRCRRSRWGRRLGRLPFGLLLLEAPVLTSPSLQEPLSQP